MNSNRERGIGFLAVIVIIAVIAVGGTAIVKSNNTDKAEVAMEEQEELDAEVNAQVQGKLVELKTVLASNVTAQVKLESAQKIVDSINGLIDEAYAKGKASVKTGGGSNSAALKARIAELEAQIQAGIAVTTESIDEFIDDLEDSLEEEADEHEGSMEENDSMENDGSMMEADGSMESEGTMTEDEGSMEAGAEVEVDGSVEVGI